MKIGLLFGLLIIVVGVSVHSIRAEAMVGTTSVATGTISGVTTSSAVATSTATSSPLYNQVQIEKRVREYFADIPVMIEIARCESNFRQFTDSGNVLRGGGGMIGVFQFYEAIHASTALALGYDLATVDGNLAYARHLYEQSGTRPWASCVPALISAAAPALTPAQKELQIKLLTKVVELLTELLKLELAKL